MSDDVWVVYLSGEIHSDWREHIARGVTEIGLPVKLTAPRTNCKLPTTSVLTPSFRMAKAWSL